MNSDENTIKKSIVRIFADIVCLLLVGIPILLFYIWGTPVKRGFFCDDLSLRYPYQESTVPSWVLYVFGLGLPIIVIIITELVLYRYSAKEKVVILNKHLPSWIWESYQNILIFGFGAACSQLITDIAKYSVGRLRPHFYDVCGPDYDCSLEKYKHKYINDYHCKGNRTDLMKDMRLSFPSGHSSFSTYCMIFLVGYIQCKIHWRGARLFKHVLQFIAVSLAFYTSLSRISDYKHHWSDVLAGAAEGALVAILIIRYVSDLIPWMERRKMAILAADLDASDSGMKLNERRGYNSRS